VVWIVLGQIEAGDINYFPARFSKPGALIAAIKEMKFFEVACFDFIALLQQTESFMGQFSLTATLTWDTLRTALDLSVRQFDHVQSGLRNYSMSCDPPPKKVLDVADSKNCLAKVLTYRALSANPPYVYEFPRQMSMLMYYLDPSRANASCASPNVHLLPSLIRGEAGNFGETAVVLTQCACDQLHEEVRTRCCNMSRMFTICFIGHVCTSA
jgi:hypothetical protein